MDVIILFDDNKNWTFPINGKSLAQVIIDNCLKYIGVQRLFISAPLEWAIGVSGKRSVFDIPLTDVKTTLFRPEPSQDALIKIYRTYNIQEAVVISTTTQVLFPFMLEEVFLKTNNSVLFSTLWSDLVVGKRNLPNLSLPSDFETIAYIYSEIELGASWDEIMEELHGKKNTIFQ